jgi:hypothetical protein
MATINIVRSVLFILKYAMTLAQGSQLSGNGEGESFVTSSTTWAPDVRL